MARNKYPEETVQLIMETASRLFMEKGYDRTSLQDIINETKLSKGAIYHHFTSKEDIFTRICDGIGAENAQRLAKVRDDKSMNGHQKLKEIFRASVLHPNQDKLVNLMPYLVENPRFLAMHIQEIFQLVVPEYIDPILQEGVRDGSIQAENTRALGEMLMILTDVCINPILQFTTPEETRARCLVFQKMSRLMGVDCLDDEVIEACVSYSEMLYKLNKK